MEKEIVLNGKTYVLKEESKEVDLVEGNWYVYTYNITKYFSRGKVHTEKEEVFKFDGSVHVIPSEKFTVRDATEEEIKNHLIKEVKMRYKIGDHIISALDDKYNGSISAMSIDYMNSSEIVIPVHDGYIYVYHNGKWAEIIKEEEIKIGKYNTKINTDGSIDVECEHFCANDVQSIARIFDLCKSANMALRIDGDWLHVFVKDGELLNTIKYEYLFKYTNIKF